MSEQVSTAIKAVLLLVFLALLVGLGEVVRTRGLREKPAKLVCTNALRQLALATIHYGEDKRLYPHVGPTAELDGDMTTSDAPRAVRALIYYSYLDDPTLLVCRDSRDLPVPVTNAQVREDMRLWSWSGASGGGATPPWRGGSDPTLLECAELSYAFTRRGLDRNVAANVALASDRGVRVSEAPDPRTPPGHTGNHVDGWNVVRADGTTAFYGNDHDFGDGSPTPAAHLRGTAAAQPALPISSVADPVVRSR